jgi:Flp pilus assembly pilin Flp
MPLVSTLLFKRLRAAFRHRRGQTLVEYALILAVLTVVLIVSFQLLGTRIVLIFSSIANLLDTAQGSH